MAVTARHFFVALSNKRLLISEQERIAGHVRVAMAAVVCLDARETEKSKGRVAQRFPFCTIGGALAFNRLS